MSAAASLKRMPVERDRRISAVVEREQTRLRRFIRRRVSDAREERERFRHGMRDRFGFGPPPGEPKEP